MSRSPPIAFEVLHEPENNLRGVSCQVPGVNRAKVGLREISFSPEGLGNVSLELLLAGEEGFSFDFVKGWLFPGGTIMLDSSELSTISWLNLVSTTRGLLATSVCPFPSAFVLREWELQSDCGESGPGGTAPWISAFPRSAGWLCAGTHVVGAGGGAEVSAGESKGW